MLCLIVPSYAGDTVPAALRLPFKSASNIPESSEFMARSTAAELLARHVKISHGNHLAKFKSGNAEKWVETKGLKLSRVTAQAVSPADQANGIAERYFVSVDSEMHRTYDGKTARWSQWHMGGNLFLTQAVKVVLGTNGEWSAHAPMLSNLVAFSARGNPDMISHGSKPVPTAKAPLPTAPTPAGRALPPVPANPIKTQRVGTVHSPLAKMAESIIRTAILAAVIVVGIPLFFAIVFGKRSRAACPRKPVRPVPPPIPASAAPLPPPLPDEPAYPEIDLMKRNSHLLTPAEQAFHAVLEPLVRSSCAISTKVRLADLFSILPGRGQQAAFNRISRKHVDFVLTDPATSRILCAIELDDSSHNRPDRIERDDFVNKLFAANGMPLLRVPVAWTYNVPGLRLKLLNAGVPIQDAA